MHAILQAQCQSKLQEDEPGESGRVHQRWEKTFEVRHWPIPDSVKGWEALLARTPSRRDVMGRRVDEEIA